MRELEVGTRVFNNGDMANIEHFGTITEIKRSKWGTDYQITPDPDSDRDAPYYIPACMFCEEYKGHGGTRFVTEDAYKEYRNKQIANFQAWVNKPKAA